MSDDDTGTKHEHTGRTVKIKNAFYNVQVWGDPDDSLEDVVDAAEDAADRAKADAAELSDNGDGAQFL